jgi:hypothetical protein
MQLQGHLRLTTLGDLLGALCRESVSGTLELTEEKGPTAGRVHALHMVCGRIVQVDSASRVAPVGEVLAELGWLEHDELPALAEQAKLANKPFGQRLVEAGILSCDVVLEGLRVQIRRRLDALFGLEDARVAFRLVRQRRRELDVSTPLGPEDYLVGRPRARDRRRGSNRQLACTPVDTSRRRDLLLLGLGPDADESMIRGAFRRLARTLHPDRYPKACPEQADALRRRFVDISAAYHRLAG